MVFRMAEVKEGVTYPTNWSNWSLIMLIFRHSFLNNLLEEAGKLDLELEKHLERTDLRQGN